MKYNFIQESNFKHYGSMWLKNSIKSAALISLIGIIRAIFKRFKDPKVRRIKTVHELESKYSLNCKLIDVITDKKKIEKLKQENKSIKKLLSDIKAMDDEQLKNWITKKDIKNSVITSIGLGAVSGGAKVLRSYAKNQLTNLK